MREHFDAALNNITKFGDTDVLPFPIEKYIFFDQRTETLELLEELHESFDEFLRDSPPHFETALSVAGYTGFRLVTQIDPIWNAYLLALVIAIGKDIEMHPRPNFS